MHCLPDGTWITLSEITAIMPHGPLMDVPSRVNIFTGYLQLAMIRFDSFEAAQLYADSLAGLVNVARANKAKE